MFFGWLLGASQDVGRHLLDACGGDLDMAVGMQMDSEGGVSQIDGQNAAAEEDVKEGTSADVVNPEYVSDDKATQQLKKWLTAFAAFYCIL